MSTAHITGEKPAAAVTSLVRRFYELRLKRSPVSILISKRRLS